VGQKPVTARTVRSNPGRTRVRDWKVKCVRERKKAYKTQRAPGRKKEFLPSRFLERVKALWGLRKQERVRGRKRLGVLIGQVITTGGTFLGKWTHGAEKKILTAGVIDEWEYHGENREGEKYLQKELVGLGKYKRQETSVL